MYSKLLLIATLIFTTATNCSKNSAATAGNLLKGSWELRSYYGGFGPTGGGTFEPGNGNVYVFDDHTYHYYENNMPKDSGVYTITTGTNPNTGEAMKAILFDTANTVPFSVSNNLLKLYRGPVAADGTVQTYARINSAGH